MRAPTHARVLASVLVHASVLLAIFLSGSFSPRIAPTRLPGTDHGTQLITYYSPGGSPTPPTSAPLRHRTPETTSASPAHAPSLRSAPHPTLAAPPTDPGTGATGASGLGQGNINIALQKFFPPPHPDLGTLSPGTQGDVVIDATIDAKGNITQLTLVHGLTDPINNAVLATVRSWTYTPATRDGTPIPSEQELLFHFQRG